MRWTTAVAASAGVLGMAGCVYGYRAFAPQPYSASARPASSYYCYDCHGYRYFDPYYDWCARYGFRYRWSDHPRVMAQYRSRYVSIREAHPEYGRYRYQPGYRGSPRYREERDYESWKRSPRDARIRERMDPERGRRGKPPARERGEKEKEAKPRREGGKRHSLAERGVT